MVSQHTRHKRSKQSKPVITAAVVTVLTVSAAAFYDVMHSMHARLSPDVSGFEMLSDEK